MLRSSLFLAITLSCAGLCAQPATIHTFTGDSVGDSFGISVSGAGDVDGDGFDDLIVGAYFDDDNGTDCGSARVFSGLTGATLYTFYGDAAGDLMGSSIHGVCGAGDVDGDGFADLIVGAPGMDHTVEISGSPVTLTDCGGARVFSGQDGSILHSFYGESSSAAFGTSVGGAGDVDADGFDDLIVGAPFGLNTIIQATGTATVFSGRDGSTLYTFYGEYADDRFGISVDGSGDVDADGFADLLVGAYRADQLPPALIVDCGKAKVFSGRTGSILHSFVGNQHRGEFGCAVRGAGDVNRDGFDDVIVGAWLENLGNGSARVFSGLDGATLHTFHGNSGLSDPGEELGAAVDGAGDVNGDGFADLIISARRDTLGAISPGSARVYCGNTGAILYTFWGNSAGDYCGWSVSGAGDVDGDGFHDLSVGIPGDDTNGTGSGSAEVFSLNLTGSPPLMRVIGHGCPGSNGHMPRIGFRRRLAVGERVDFLLRGAASNAICTLVLAGPDDQDVSLTFPGLAGCWQYVRTDYIWAWTVTDINGMASFAPVWVPNSPSLIGDPMNAQWGIQDVGANPFGATTSNALEMVFGT